MTWPTIPKALFLEASGPAGAIPPPGRPLAPGVDVPAGRACLTGREGYGLDDHRSRNSVSTPMRAAPSEPTLITNIDSAVMPAAPDRSSGVCSARYPNHQKMTAATRKGTATATHHGEGDLSRIGPSRNVSVSGGELPRPQLSAKGAEPERARSPAWARARLSRKAVSAPSGADAMILLIASFTSATSPASTVNISRARRSYSAGETGVRIVTLPSVFLDIFGEATVTACLG